jgi:hypothetical protein
MQDSIRRLFAEHWLVSSALLPWFAAVWDALHGEWWRMAGVLAYLELVGGPITLLK